MSVKEKRLDKLDNAQAKITTLESKLEMFRNAMEMVEGIIDLTHKSDAEKIAAIKAVLSGE
jgi:hypothetical protein